MTRRGGRRAATVLTHVGESSDRMTRHRFILAIPLAIVLTACGFVSRDEVARVGSPDGRVDAVLVETNDGATTAFGYEIHIVERGKSYGEAAATLHGAVRNENAYGANLRWLTDSDLLVEYQRALAQVIERTSVRVAGRDIRIVLRPGVLDSNAPAGGMLYNLEPGRRPAQR